MRAAALPAPYDVVALGNQISCAPEVEIRKCFTKADHKVSYIVATPTRCMQRILEEHVRGREFIDNSGIPRVAPELFEPATHDGLVLLLSCHVRSPSVTEDDCGTLVDQMRCDAPSGDCFKTLPRRAS